MHGGNDYLHIDETTFGNIFQNNGYATGMWGKWHSGKSDGYWPWDRGFDEGYFANLYKYFPSNGWYNEYPKVTTHKDKWSPTALVDYTIDFIGKNQEKPFLAYLSFLTCHDFWKTPDKYKKKYLKDGRTERYATLLGMLEFMDEEVGRLLKHLSDNELDENTVVIFMSDNGPNLGDTNSEEWALRNNHGFIGNKAKLWQNGIKSPLYIRWKGHYKPADVERLVTVTDIFPTLLDIAELDLPEDNLPLDGRSFKPYIEGDTKSLSERKTIIAHWFPVWEKDQFSPIQLEEKANFDFEKQRLTMVNENYKLIQNPSKTKGAPERYNQYVLIDTKANLVEKENIAKENPDIVNAMKSEMEQWFEDVKNENHSFAPPVFQIGWKGKKLSEIRAYGASKAVGVTNESHKITGFDKVGDYSEYKINVHKKGTYNVSIGSNIFLKGMSVKVCCNKESTEVRINGKENKIGSIKLAEGEHILKVEVSAVDNSIKNKNHLTEIFLERQ
jgi:arylsulfatase A-like enzyme